MQELASSLVELTMTRNRFLGQLFFLGQTVNFCRPFDFSFCPGRVTIFHFACGLSSTIPQCSPRLIAGLVGDEKGLPCLHSWFKQCSITFSSYYLHCHTDWGACFGSSALEG
ncbi:hypothetical protein ACSQ67_022361 [Phaseolus vulgaris]